MKLTSVVKRLEREYENALKNPSVEKPMSYALYRAWKWCDTYEKGKRNASEDICKKTD